MYYPEKLRQRRQEMHLKQTDVAEAVGVSKQSYFAWEKGTSQPTKANLIKLEQLLKVPMGYLTENQISSLYRQLNQPNQVKALTYVQGLVEEQTKVVHITSKEPRYAYRVYERLSAGVGSAVYDDRDYDTVYFDQELAHDFASWIEGDSMEPTYKNHDVALIRETGFDYDGAIYAVVWNDQTYIKKVYREEDGLRLVSINTDYQDKFAPYDENPRIVGKIVGAFTPLEV
ncbi:XRE family transcriptional regulator [Streptococcus ovis]|uniref:XRE family transcriptional regulator n=1 Tax=Streptococcus ovis TaxID=82806 RepID=UPI000374D632|nr:XRE family transcriptional regulator [Streptococcus ovis]